MPQDPRHTLILMATFQGAKHLPEQLSSIASQNHKNWSLLVSDDGSTDETRYILAAFADQQTEHEITLVEGPGRGAIANFLSLLERAPDWAETYAFADQDDVWLAHRLERSLQLLPDHASEPCLYGSRTVITDAVLKPTGLSPLFCKPAAFSNALVQSIAGGNTMTFNRAALDLMREGGLHRDVVAHDWWMYQVVAGAGGRVIYDDQPSIHYRQHERNEIGANLGLLAQWHRARALVNDRFSGWNTRNIAALNGCRHLLLPENQALLDCFAELQTKRGPSALKTLKASGLYRQTFAGDLSLKAAAFLGKI